MRRGWPPAQISKNGLGNVTTTVRRFALLALVAAIGIVVIFAAVFMFRLSQGPVSLTFLRGPIENAINTNLAGYQVEVEDAIIERDRKNGQPRVRLRNVAVRDETGTTIARAPRAAIGIDGKAIFAGRLVPRQLELIGPHIELYRHLDGGLSLGFASKGAGGELDGGRQEAAGSRKAGEAQEDATTARQLHEFLSKELLSRDGGTTAVSSLEAVKISNATLALFDEFNQASWEAPAANLVFRRMPYGFALFADITVASGNQPWRSELVANYRMASRSFAVSARIFDLVPADISSKVFALHQLAQVRFPLSGKAELELTEDGVITRATAELTASRGVIGFPDYIADPIAISEGLLRMDLDPATGALLISDSTLSLGGSQAQINGKIVPRRLDDGRLTGLEVFFNARNLSMGSVQPAEDTLQFERVELKGLASVIENRFDIEDFILQTGNAGVRVRGSFEGQDEAIGVRLNGVMRNLPMNVVKKLWPPMIAPVTRKWLNANVSKGYVPEGEFRIDVPGEAIAAAFRGVPLADRMIDVQFSLRDVETRYFAKLPPITGAKGSGRLQGDHFDLLLEDGEVTLPSGGKLAFLRGRLETPTLRAPVIPTKIHVEARGGAEHFLELLDQEPLNYAANADLDPRRIGGSADANIDVDLKFQKGRKPIIAMSALAEVKDVRLKGVFEQADIEGGDMTVTYGDGRVSASGTVQLNKVPSFVQWSKNIGKNLPREEKLHLEAELDDRERLKLGLDMGGFVHGPVRIKLTADQPRGKLARAKVEAILTKAELRIDAMRWWRPPGIQSRASFDVDFTDPEVKTISNLQISGGNVSIRGDVRISPNGEVLSADFPKVVLDEENRFRMKLRRREGAAVANVSGEAFDARHLINGMFKSDATGGTRKTSAPGPLTIQAEFDRVYTNRGEVLTGVKGKLDLVGNTVQRADIQGTFLNGAPATIKIVPTAEYRDLSIVIGDAGAALRAANLYSKAAGGQLELRAQLGNGADSSIKRGLLTIRNFTVRDETTLEQINRPDRTPQSKSSGPRNQALVFTKLTMPFSTDPTFVRIGDSLLKGPELGAAVQGVIRKRDGALDIGGTIIPAYSLNSALGELPLLGELLTGGKGQGVFGLTFGLRGTLQQPRFIANPVSALAPGFLRRIFDMGGYYPEPGQKKPRMGIGNERTN
jgi:hypothetical protein